MTAEAEERVTTADLQQAISDKYTKNGQYEVFFDVPDAVSTAQRRRADAIAVGMWGSTGNRILGLELKVSRSDWLREVRAVEKADPFLEVCDHWWLVTGSRSIAKLDEVPASWGWMAMTDHGLRVEKPSPRLRAHTEQISRAFALGLLRKASGSKLASAEVQVVIKKMRGDFDKLLQERVEQESHRNGQKLEELKRRVEKFEAASGLKISDWDLGAIGTIVKQIREMNYHGSGLNAVARHLEGQQRELESLVESVKRARAAIVQQSENGPV